jgi:hypothetical protein
LEEVEAATVSGFWGQGLGGPGGGGNGRGDGLVYRLQQDHQILEVGEEVGWIYSGGGPGAGGSGIVIIRYPGPPIATGGTITSVDGDTIHTFTATGSHTFTVF